MKKPGVMFVVAGIIFCALTAITRDVAPFLPVGIALIILGLAAIWRYRQSQHPDYYSTGGNYLIKAQEIWNINPK